MKDTSRLMMVVLFVAVAGFAAVPLDKAACPNVTGDEPITGHGIPYFGDRQSPGDSIGMTAYDYQANGSSGQRLFVDDLGQAHIDWMKMVSGTANRRCEWQFRYPDGTLYGEVDASPLTSGYAQLDVTQDANPDSQRSVITYQYNPGTYYSWIDVDYGNGYGIFPNNPMPWPMAGYRWPHIGVAANNNIVIFTRDDAYDFFHAAVTTDMGTAWTLIADIDSVMSISRVVRASRHSSKVVLAWTQSIALEYGAYLISMMANDVFYMLSTDNGITWSAPVNVTNYLPPGQMTNGDTTPWAYCDVNAVFDSNDNLHLAWSTNMGWKQNDTIYFDDRAKIFHWDQVSDTIMKINSPSTYYYEPNGWWLEGSAGLVGAWRLACDEPQLVAGPGDTLYCLWHGNDDTTDVSAGGYFNGEFYGAFSTDDGLTWSDYVNLTNTRSPGAPPGECMDEDYMTANPFVVNDSIYLTYIEDKDAGAFGYNEGVVTQNPVRCWVFHKNGVIYGVEEESQSRKLKSEGMRLEVYPNPSSDRLTIKFQSATILGGPNPPLSPFTKGGQKGDSPCLKIYDASGRLVKEIYNGNCGAGAYNLDIPLHDFANGTYFVVLTVLTTANRQYLGSVVIVH